MSNIKCTTLSYCINCREEGVTIPSEQDILMPRDRILVLISEDSEQEDLSDSLGIQKLQVKEILKG